MTIFSESNSYFIKSKDGQLHSTRYATKDKAAEAARKMAAGLVHFSPIIKQITKANLSNTT